MTKNRWECWIN